MNHRASHAYDGFRRDLEAFEKSIELTPYTIFKLDELNWTVCGILRRHGFGDVRPILELCDRGRAMLTWFTCRGKVLSTREDFAAVWRGRR